MMNSNNHSDMDSHDDSSITPSHIIDGNPNDFSSAASNKFKKSMHSAVRKKQKTTKNVKR